MTFVRLPGTDPGAPFEAADERLADDSADTAGMLSLLQSEPGGSAANCALGLLAAHRLRREARGRLIALALNFWAAPTSLPSCRWEERLDCEGRARFRIGGPGQPVSLTGTAWFGCGPGPSR
jgi:hypothetical protein